MRSLTHDLKEELLLKAEELIFSTGIGDVAEKLCFMNTRYGIAKLLYMQKEFGIKKTPYFLGTPDMTITRNRVRWNQGFGYGGKISFGPKIKNNFFPLDIKPNACGMLVGGIHNLPSYTLLIEKLSKLEEKKIEIDGIPIKWDFYDSNHFIDVFEIEPLGSENFPPYAFILHTSASELKDKTKKGIGLYFDVSKSLREKSKILNTPFGPLYYLEGADVKEYIEFYFYAQSFAERKRLIAAEELFGSFDIISNDTHQGILNEGEVLLGAHYFEDENKIFPFVMRSDLPAYLVKGIPNIKKEVLKSLDFLRRAKKYGLLEELKNSNLIPHGSGYNFPHILSINGVREVQNRRLFELLLTWGTKGVEIIETPRDLPFEYRGQKVFIRIIELSLAKPVAKLNPVYVLKF